MVLIWAFLLLAALLYLNSRRKEPPKIAGVYTQPGKWYWLKVVVFYLLIRFRKWKDARDPQRRKDHTNVETYEAGYGTKSKSSPEEMEKVQPLSSHFQAIDAIFFNGANQQGFSLITGTARRPHGAVNGFIIVRVPGVGTFVSPKFPCSLLFGGTDKYYGAEGFRYEPVTPMRHWRLRYEGKLKLHEDHSKTFTVSLQADWKSELPYFDYDTMIPVWTMARAIAKEPWSREYFNALKEAHQTHYEQHGTLAGEITVDGKAYKFEMPSMRDHSYGVKRDWKLLHRYMFEMFNVSDGRRFNIAVVSQPCTMSELELGYMYEADGTLHPLERVDMPLPYLGEGGDPPKDYALRCRATNGKEYYIQVQVLETQEVHHGWEWEARVVERRCRYMVDGVEGIGISECMYRWNGGRPAEYTRNDPEWTKVDKII